LLHGHIYVKQDSPVAECCAQTRAAPAAFITFRRLAGKS
jgi:hypothetical protein